jgi:hypothetical protein
MSASLHFAGKINDWQLHILSAPPGSNSFRTRLAQATPELVSTTFTLQLDQSAIISRCSGSRAQNHAKPLSQSFTHFKFRNRLFYCISVLKYNNLDNYKYHNLDVRIVI